MNSYQEVKSNSWKSATEVFIFQSSEKGTDFILLKQASANYNLQTKFSLLVFIKFHWNIITLIHLRIVYVSFHTTLAELQQRSCGPKA